MLPTFLRRYLLTGSINRTILVLLFFGGILGYFERYQPPDTRVYAALAVPQERVGRVFSEAEIGCLTQVVYNESRGEPVIGQVAVAAVVLNRLYDHRFRGTTICSITKQPKQFVWLLPKKDVEQKALADARRIATYVVCNYHSLEGLHEYKFFNSNKPRKGATMIGRHAFYT